MTQISQNRIINRAGALLMVVGWLAGRGACWPQMLQQYKHQLPGMWVLRNQPPSLFFCRHDQFAASAARQIVPVEPEWLIPAMGVVSFEPTEQHQGPFAVHGGRLEIRSTPPPTANPSQGVSRITIV